jgi:hypothetical protein
LTNTGATAIGVGAQAGATAPGEINATAVGNGALANAANATALGQGSTASDTGSTALVTNAQATGTNAIATGGAGNVVNAPTASGAQSIAIGFLSSSTSQFATSLGTQSAATGFAASAIGSGTIATGDGATALGTTNVPGQFTNAAGVNSVAIEGGMANAADSTPLGAIPSRAQHRPTASPLDRARA